MSSEKKQGAQVDLDQVRHIANLAQMALSPAEEKMLQDQLNQVLHFFGVLDSVDTQSIEPMSHSLELQTPFDSDTPRPGLSLEAAMKNAPDQEEGQIRVPAILE